MYRNICFIGLPYSGKTRFGNSISKTLHKGFIDTDKMIEYKYGGRKLRDIIQQTSERQFLQLENDVIQSIHCDNNIISTGGSSVYGKCAMKHLQNNLSCHMIHLYVSFDEFIRRAKCFEQRGVIKPNQLGMLDFYEDRIQKYETYCDTRIDVSNKKITMKDILYQIDDINDIQNGTNDYSI